MDPEQEIQISRLLMQREGLLVRIYEIEQEVQHLAPTGIQLPAPPTLPSLEKRKKKSGRARGSTARAASSAKTKLPPLQEPEENAFLLEYSWLNQSNREIHQDTRLLQQVLESVLPGVRILKVEAGHLSTNGNFAATRDVTEEAAPS
jgi:hypothetical protein